MSAGARTLRQEAQMARELSNPPDLHPAPGFSHMATADGTGVVHLAGQLGLNADFSLAADDLYGQTVKAMQNVEIALRAAGAGWDDVVRRTIYTVHPTAHQALTQASRERSVGGHHP